MVVDTLAIVGVGLLGGSVGLAALEQRVARNVIGIGRDPLRLRAAADRRAVTETTTDLLKGVFDAELVVVCTPVASVVDTVRQIAAVCRRDTLITDVGSTKADIVAGADQAIADAKGLWAKFVGSHPLAGSERTGVEFARADLFQDKVVVVTPSSETKEEATARIERFWSALGARVQRLSPSDHDAAIAMTSHVPHVVAAALAAATPRDMLPLTATGWSDTTRIAAGDVELWKQILLSNRDNTLRGLDEVAKLLAAYRAALAAGDAEALSRLLTQGKRIRDTVGN